jgi:hypothetical protein
MYTYKERLELFIQREQKEISQIEKVLKTLSNNEIERKQRLEQRIENKTHSLMAYQTALIYYEYYKVKGDK